ncbi:type 1 glutamine amidotransferase domain-containing protein [Sutterella sp.]|uniref:type 1 glutamine amidotransferase domain-containing protein n=1 Tax=Sutterella sp. TaxID=1981025 RepID=UPI0026DEABA7|nr:type 1 glutamine amidotransferase domain-containing protein [Sutterella sp.]MDO5531365.1 type 1 glutamine amidotransferase domain-containing protein [Sutterella sp.]
MNSLSILVIATAHAALGTTGGTTGVWLEELSTPYYAFIDAGAKVTVATLNGGVIPVDPHSVSDDKSKNPATVNRFLADKAASATLTSSVRLADLNPADYAAVFIPGGHGAMWDLAGSEALGAFLTKAWKSGAVIGSVCHGPAAFSLAKNGKGEPLVSGLTVTSFSDSEETKMQLTTTVPFLLESRLRSQGAKYVKGADFTEHAVRDGRLVTGQNPMSSEKAAKLVLEAVKEAR